MTAYKPTHSLGPYQYYSREGKLGFLGKHWPFCDSKKEHFGRVRDGRAPVRIDEIVFTADLGVWRLQ